MTIEIEINGAKIKVTPEAARKIFDELSKVFQPQYPSFNPIQPIWITPVPQIPQTWPNGPFWGETIISCKAE